MKASERRLAYPGFDDSSNPTISLGVRLGGQVVTELFAVLKVDLRKDRLDGEGERLGSLDHRSRFGSNEKSLERCKIAKDLRVLHL